MPFNLIRTSFTFLTEPVREDEEDTSEGVVVIETIELDEQLFS